MRGLVRLSMLATLATAAAGACSSQPRPWEQPHRGWQAVYSDHFVLYTESWFPVYRYVLDRLEDTHAGLSRVFFEDAPVSGIEVLLLSDEDYVALLGGYSSGMFFPRTPARDGLLVIRQSRHRSVIDTVVAHELVHKFIAARYPSMPAWLDEGIAEYLATLKVNEDEVQVGRLAPETETKPFGRQALVSLRELAHANGEVFHGEDAAPSYQTATAFVRWLLQPRAGGLDRTRWRRLVGAYRAGARVPDSPDAIMARVYPELSWTELQREVQAHEDRLGRASRYPIWVFPFQPLRRGHLETAPADLGYIKSLCQALRKPAGQLGGINRASDGGWRRPASEPTTRVRRDQRP